jgi:hypothetical protein
MIQYIPLLGGRYKKNNLSDFCLVFVDFEIFLDFFLKV